MSLADLTRAQLEADTARARFASTLGALQYRLRPATLMNNAWEGVRDKSSELADDALQAAKERPLAVSGALAGFLMFLAREPLRAGITRLLKRDEGDRDDGAVTTRIDTAAKAYNASAPDLHYEKGAIS